MKKSVLVVLLGLFLIGMIGMVVAENENVTCVSAGQSADEYSFGKYIGPKICCEGLIKISDMVFNNGVCQQLPDAGIICSNCGNNLCERDYENICNCPIDCNSSNVTSSPVLDCKNLYWFDDNSRECGYKQFCGLYAYPGLRTFINKDECEMDFKKNCKKVCKQIGTRSEGWYDSCTGALINYDNCGSECRSDLDCPQVSCAQGAVCQGLICREGKCVTGGEEISEKITCKFEGAGEKDQACYLAGSWTKEDEGKKFCDAEDGNSCVISYSSFKGEKVTWKSSCGGYQYTTQDGNDETIYFKCSEGEANISEIKDKGFRYAKWECYNGKEWKSQGENCLSSELWQKKAKNFCNSECNGEKCGVNSFSLGADCYLDDVKYTICNPGDDIQKCCRSWAEKNNLVIPTCLGGWNIEMDQCIFSCKEETEFSNDTLICKDACALNGKCYPTNNRKDGKYCSVNGVFEKQFKGEEKCDNNFECESNVCVGGKCVSQGFLEKIMNWFRKMFGGNN